MGNRAHAYAREKNLRKILAQNEGSLAFLRPHVRRLGK